MNEREPQDPAPFGEVGLGEFTQALAARTPVPGGGAAAGSALAHGAALGSMVVAFSIDKRKFEAHREILESMTKRLDIARSSALELADRDARGFERLAALWSKPEDDPQRLRAWEPAVIGAIDPPASLVRLAVATTSCLARLVGRTSRLLRSDLSIAAGFCSLAADAAAWNVRVNLDSLRRLEGRAGEADELEQDIADAVAECRALSGRIETACLENAELPIVDP